jgi:AcrR family transcriptional regulator
MSTETRQRRGRPRSEDADRAILDSAFSLLAEQGYSGMTVEAVAVRAGVGKATIYRRWPSKAELTFDALDRIPAIPDPERESLRADLVTWLGDLRENLASTGPVLAALVGERPRHPELAKLIDAWVDDRRKGLVTLLRRGVDRGELPADTDVNLAIDLLTGPIVGRVLFTGSPGGPHVVEPVVGSVLDGIA